MFAVCRDLGQPYVTNSSSHSQVDGAGELSYLAEMSGINAIISPEDIDLENEEVVNKQEISIKTRNDYLNALEAHGQKKPKYICDKMPHNMYSLD